VKGKPRLSPSMTLAELENGYWYAAELKVFAGHLGVPSAGKLRKDELERAIRLFLETGEVRSPTKRSLATGGAKDVERGLALDLPVAIYTNDRETKEFLDREARKLVPGFRRRSGVRYRLNRWREEQLAQGVKIRYRDLVAEYVRLNRQGAFARIPHGRYINFMSDFLASEKGATREDAVKAWHQLKVMDAPKDYRSWRERTRR
jgi:SAP domain-containing new25